jgi:hypothetical protein
MQRLEGHLAIACVVWVVENADAMVVGCEMCARLVRWIELAVDLNGEIARELHFAFLCAFSTPITRKANLFTFVVDV